MFSNRSLVKEHERIHVNDTGLLNCPKCNKQFLRGGKVIQAHINKCHGILVETRRAFKYPCFECGKIFYSKVTCAEHLAADHNVILPNVEKFCFECKTEVENPFRHAMSHHNSFECHLCGNRSSTKEKLEKHMERHLSDKSRPFSCELCSLTFKTSNHALSHKLAMHTSSQDKRFICTICDKRFGFKYQLNTHNLQVHTEVRKFNCPFCSRKFKRVGHMKYHCKSDHGESNVYQCTDCPEKLNSLNDLRKHRKEQH